MAKSYQHPSSSGVPSQVTVKPPYGGTDPYATNPGNGNPLIKNAQPGEPDNPLPASPADNF